MTERHYYYLHTNGELIYKPAIVVESDTEYFESDCVRKFWPVDLDQRESAYVMLIEAAALGARMSRVLELAAKWGMDGDDGIVFLARMGFDCRPTVTEGGTGYSVHHEFDDDTRSRGFGSSPLLAMISYVRAGDFTSIETTP